MKRLVQVSTSLMLAAVVLAGCGGDEEDSDAKTGDPGTTQSDPTSGEPSEAVEETDWGKPATGPTITGDGYTYNVTKGWGDITARAKKVQSFVDSAASETAPTDGFADNVNVGFQADQATLDQLEDSIATQLRTIVDDLEILPRVTVDGVEALHHRGPAVSGGTKFFLDQFAAVLDDRIAIITFSFNRAVPVSERDAVVSSVMASWKWS